MKKLLFLTVFTIVIFGCSKDDSTIVNGTGITPTVKITGVYNISFTTATYFGAVSTGGSISEVGACWSTSPNPTVSDAHTPGVLSAYDFTGSITSLVANTTYYVRTYAISPSGTYYSAQTTFNTIATQYSNGSGVIDNDGNSCASVKINSVEWLKTNLNVTHYRNGDVIPEVTDPALWNGLTTGAWCYYNNDPANGKLYNWYAVNDPRGLAPAGWHIPTDAEWSSLTTFLGGENVAGQKLKDNGATSWAASSISFNTNQSGFSALATGVGYLNYHYVSGSTPALSDLFKWQNEATYWWSSTLNGSAVWTLNVAYQTNATTRSVALKTSALSVRCVKN
jgi:uncharacterized protein (TIGR02145 family)